MRERFVPLWVEDEEDDRFASRVGIREEGYPNVAVYGPGEEYLGRVVGFPGHEAWFENLKEVTAVGDRLAEAREKARADGAGWVEVAAILATIPDRSDDAIAALENVPEAARDEAYERQKAFLGAQQAWDEVAERIDARMRKDGRNPAKAMAAASEIVGWIDAWLERHRASNDEVAPQALGKKGFFLLFQQKPKEAIAVVRELLEAYPDSHAALRVLHGGLRY